MTITSIINRCKVELLDDLKLEGSSEGLMLSFLYIYMYLLEGTYTFHFRNIVKDEIHSSFFHRIDVG